MTETNKPAWVDALEEAKTNLRAATASAADAQQADAHTRVAHAWIDVARMLKG